MNSYSILLLGPAAARDVCWVELLPALSTLLTTTTLHTVRHYTRTHRRTSLTHTHHTQTLLPAATLHTAGHYNQRQRKHIRLRQWLSVAPWWVSLSKHCGIKSVLPPVGSLRVRPSSRRVSRVTTCTHDIDHRSRHMSRITTPRGVHSIDRRKQDASWKKLGEVIFSGGKL